MSFSSDLSFSEELNKSLDSLNIIRTLIEKEEGEEESILYSEEKPVNKRRISKISLQMEELKNKKNIQSELDDISTDEYDVDFEENSIQNKQNVNSINQNENIFGKFEINFPFKFNQKEFIISIESDLLELNKNTTEDLIKNIIKKINGKNIFFRENKYTYIISLKDCEEEMDKEFYKDNYELIQNSCIKYPYELLLNKIKENKFNLSCKNSLNIMIRKI
jgi:hypothetical protein